ncbi:MAG: hypothetical protein ACREHE_13880 [Rhizomicrobium sp.]
MTQWTIPVGLEGCWAKIRRSDESIRNLKTEIDAFLNGNPKPYEVLRKFSPDGLEYLFIVKGDPLSPLRFSVLAGEIVHHLRSSLDHLITALVIRNGSTPTKNHHFPICRTAKSWSVSCKDGSTNRITATAKKIIDENQPDKSVPDDDAHPLSVIHAMDIEDKHRLLTVVTQAAQLGDRITLGTNEEIARTLDVVPGRTIVGFGDPRPKRMTREGVEVFKIVLGSPDPTFQAEADIVPQVAFEKCGRAELVPVIDALLFMQNSVATTLDQFKTEF